MQSIAEIIRSNKQIEDTVVGVGDSTWTTLLWSGVALCALAPLCYAIFVWAYSRFKPERRSKDIESEIRRLKKVEDLTEAQQEFERRKQAREAQMKKFEERHKK